MREHVFVDENKSRGLLLAAACFPPAGLSEARRALTNLLLPGQERIHFNSERDSRRHVILRSLEETGMRGIVIRAELSLPPRSQRRQCFQRLMNEAQTSRMLRICIEQDDSMLEFDRHVMYEATRVRHLVPEFSYSWLRPRQEPLLWAADALAWSWARGGVWRERVRSGVTLIDLAGS